MPYAPITPRLTPTGKRVHKWLFSAFQGRHKLLDWRDRLRCVQQELRGVVEGQEWAREIDVGAINRLLDAAVAEVMDGLPYAECDCPASEKNCPKCKGRRWVTARTYHLNFNPLDT